MNVAARTPKFLKNWRLYWVIRPAFLEFLLVQSWPRYGVQIAFRDFNPALGITGSPWVGFDHLDRFFQSYYFWALIKNTLFIALYQLALFPLPIIVALSMNEVASVRFKKFVQTVTYAPH
ncbi:MAG: binding-protein-dependent transport system inner rane component, partial [Paenibacillaceae bacterium]|nr:binding-protein-dependent transport system inner rane component [Paenibacillaceae bacterium]